MRLSVIPHPGASHNGLTSCGRTVIAWPSTAPLGALADELGIVLRSRNVLTPQADSPRPSFSQVHGLGGFPWHTDGALRIRPPRWLLMRALETCDTPTLLLDGHELTERMMQGEPLLGAVWKVTGGRRPFFAPMVGPRDGALRWNPDIMSPVGRQAVSIDRLLRARLAAEPGIPHDWEMGEVLLIDNHRWLHARPEVADSDLLGRRLERILGD